MIRYERPLEPPTFATTVTSARSAIEAAVDPVTGRVLAAWGAVSWPTHWSKFKSELKRAQHGKCAYCERVCTGHGDVEHFKPKKRVAEILSEGTEDFTTLGVSGRSPKNAVTPGYWWLAYEWDNYLLACSQCNSKWKISFVSVDPPFTMADMPRKLRKETFALVNPYDDEPSAHMTFDVHGFVSAVDSRGTESIRIYGLDRPSLIDHRRDAYRGARAVAREYQRGTTTMADVKDALHPRRPFAAARRAGASEGFGDKPALVRGLVAKWFG